MKQAIWLLTLSLSMIGAYAAEPSRLQRVLASRELRVCIWPDYYGISYRNPNTRQLSGLDVDMALALAADLGVRIRFVDSSFSKLIQDVAQDQCDIAMFGIGITPARAAALRFTRPHLMSGMYAITTRNNRRITRWADIDKPNVVVAVLKGTIQETLLRGKLTAATLLVVDGSTAREQEVEAGRADLFMTDFPYSRRMLDNTDWARLVAPPVPYEMTSYAYAVAPGDDLWLSRIERFVDAIKHDGRLQESARRHKLDPIMSRR